MARLKLKKFFLSNAIISLCLLLFFSYLFFYSSTTDSAVSKIKGALWTTALLYFSLFHLSFFTSSYRKVKRLMSAGVLAEVEVLEVKNLPFPLQKQIELRLKIPNGKIETRRILLTAYNSYDDTKKIPVYFDNLNSEWCFVSENLWFESKAD